MNPKQFATEVTHKLQRAGHTALWAGGCVRDALLNLAPKDYDVATSATPEEVRAIFGTRKTIPIGAAFGVITVIGPKSAGHIEVATFRRDGGYSDGRRPDSVEFTNAREDAIRRDFTINGMFFDPISAQVIDYVGGQEDLQKRCIRAIGDPEKRIEEDKLRMMRGVRFAATYDFQIEPATLQAIQKRASEIEVVSPERIGNELKRMLSHHNFRVAIDLLNQTGLWKQVLPSAVDLSENAIAKAIAKAQTIHFSAKNDAPFESIVATLLSDSFESGGGVGGETVKQSVEELQDCWRLTNEQASKIMWLAQHWATINRAEQLPWSKVQPIVADRRIHAGIDVANALGGRSSAISFCAKKLALDRSELDPPPLLVGKDLIALGIVPGPLFKTILKTVRNQQLDGEIESIEQARGIAQRLAAKSN